ncbi:MAG TPA: PspC domain-containing protein [Cyclobacteriaceae bacterium]|nr:PspC domain-containing protein [Cyclobacteriaceae bacterium]
MKKNISINISGIIFHIEEDGYDQLKKYLDSINKYFSAFDDSSEILADIESRIAEIFLSKLNEGKQVITAEDVASLMGTMGSVSDFKEAEEKEYAEKEAANAGSAAKEDTAKKTYKAKSLLRDKQRKIFGGVCAGLAHYFNIDPVWPRVLFALLILGTKGIFLVAYFILWIVMPASAELEENTNIKKMYRDSEGKVLGGVAQGLSKYFALDVAVIRLIFVVLAFAWLIGVVLYIILWIALPEAKTITERMQMQGEPVTLSNIESSIKKSLSVKEDQDENVWVKILLFPFRLISVLITWIGKALGPVLLFLVDIIRVFTGLIIAVVGLSFFVSIMVISGVFFGLYAAENIDFFSLGDIGVPMELLLSSFPAITGIAFILGMLMLALFLILSGISLIAKKIVFNAAVGWSMFAIFVISVAALSFTVPKIVLDFRERGRHTEETVIPLAGKTVVIKTNENGDSDYSRVRLRITSHESNEIILKQEFQANGKSKREAIENAQMIQYQFAQDDSVLVFNTNFTFADEAIFRGQTLFMVLYMPKDQLLYIPASSYYMISNYVAYNQRANNTWKVTDDGIVCITCPEEKTVMNGIGAFNEVEIAGLFNVKIEKGVQYNYEISGPNRKDVEVKTTGNKLNIKLEESSIRMRTENRIVITVPDLQKITMAGAGKLEVIGLNEEKLDINLAGAIKANMDVEVDELDINMAGVSTLDLKGSGKNMKASLAGSAHLRAAEFKVVDARVDAVGASSARVNVSGNLQQNAMLGSSIRNVN